MKGPNMPKCAKCLTDAKYLVENTSAANQHFCEIHLPAFFNKSKLPTNIKLLASILPVTPEPTPVVAEPVIETPIIESTPEPVVEEPVLEMNRALPHSTMTETAPEVIEEPVAEAPKPKAPKKKKPASK